MISWEILSIVVVFYSVRGVPFQLHELKPHPPHPYIQLNYSFSDIHSSDLKVRHSIQDNLRLFILRYNFVHTNMVLPSFKFLIMDPRNKNLESEIEMEIANYMARTTPYGAEELGPDTNKHVYENRMVQHLVSTAMSNCLFPNGCDMEMFKKKKVTPPGTSSAPLRIAKNAEEARMMRGKGGTPPAIDEVSDSAQSSEDMLFADSINGYYGMHEFFDKNIPLKSRREEISVRIAANQAERSLPSSSRKHDVIGERIRVLKTIDKDIVKMEYEEQRRAWCKNRRFIRKLSMSWKISINHLLATSLPPPSLEAIRDASEPVGDPSEFFPTMNILQELEQFGEPAILAQLCAQGLM